MKKIWALLSAFLLVFLFISLSDVFSFAKSDLSILLRRALVVFSALLFFVFYFLMKKMKTVLSDKKHIPYAFCAAFLSLSVIALSIYKFYSVTVLKAAVSNISFFASPYFYIGYTVLGLFGAVYYLTVAISEFTGEKHYIQHPIFSLMPSLWLCYALFVSFAENVGSVSNIESGIKTLAIAFSMIFMFYKARKTCFNEKEDNMSALFGSLAFVFSFSGAVGFFASFIVNQKAFSVVFLENIVLIFMALYAFFFLTSIREEKN